MSEDILHRVLRQTLNPTLQRTAEMYNETLIMIENMCSLMAKKVLSCLGMTANNRHMHDALNHELQSEQHYDTEALAETVRTNVPQLNQRQRIAYDTLIEAVNSGSGGIYFIDAPGGTGKTFLISLLLALENSCDSTIRWANCTFCLEITIKHANQRNTNLQHIQN